MYANNPNPTETYGVLATVVTSAKVADDTVYALVKAVFDNFDEFKKLHPAFAHLDPEGHDQERPVGAAASGRDQVLQGKGLDVALCEGAATSRPFLIRSDVLGRGTR